MRHIVPNLITLSSICVGLSAVKFALSGKFDIAAVCIIGAALLDALDGRVARALKGASKFGAELDSLADVVNFGAVPALVLYIRGLNAAPGVGWFACLIFVIAVALRLARFNVMNNMSEETGEDMKKPPKSYFIGVPAPVGAGLALFPLFTDLAGYAAFIETPTLCGFYLILSASAVVGTLKTFSIKSVRFNSARAIPTLFAAAVCTAFLITFPWSALTVLCAAYWIYLGVVVTRVIFRDIQSGKIVNRIKFLKMFIIGPDKTSRKKQPAKPESQSEQPSSGDG